MKTTLYMAISANGIIATETGDEEFLAHENWEKRFEKALVTGGANINSAFAKANLLDEITLNVEPVFVGRGIPLFAPQDFELNLQLISNSKSDKGILTLSYSVVK